MGRRRRKQARAERDVEAARPAGQGELLSVEAMEPHVEERAEEFPEPAARALNGRAGELVLFEMIEGAAAESAEASSAPADGDGEGELRVVPWERPQRTGFDPEFVAEVEAGALDVAREEVPVARTVAAPEAPRPDLVLEHPPEPEPTAAAEAVLEPEPPPPPPARIAFDEPTHPDLALAQLEAARAAHPDDPEVLVRLGWTLGVLGRYDDAERELRRAQKLAPDDVGVRAGVGFLAFRRGLYQQADVELRWVCEHDPEHGPAHFYRGEALNRLGRVDQALEALERAVRLEPANHRAYYTMGMLFDRKNLREEAAAMYRKARELRAAASPERGPVGTERR